ncbi:hypothetical protein CQW23_32068 [Capsicum baccatum]|uniref:Kinesin motor domain-containing protein n=1 Tax=Capsicum baccatum TaxID=33114 RepID=A0A2G2V5Q7_CAPBA|nr:hypothetical protein CQW23_32068 [Capsicum baccatum]
MKALSIEKQPTVDPLSAAPLNVEHEDNEELMGDLTETELYTPKQPECDLKNQPTAKTPIDEPPMLELQELPDYLRYVFLESGNILPESADNFSEQHIEALIAALKRYKRAMGWTIDDIIGDSPEKRRSHLEKDRMPTGTMAPKARQGKEKATTSQKSKKRGRKEQGEPSSLQIPRLTLGIKWETYEELLRMMTLMMTPMQGRTLMTLRQGMNSYDLMRLVVTRLEVISKKAKNATFFLMIIDVPTIRGRLMLVDMAGSENIEQAGQTGMEAKMQTAKINQGNSALKRVVESIANGDSHVPFRDNKLTMLLQQNGPHGGQVIYGGGYGAAPSRKAQ